LRCLEKHYHGECIAAQSNSQSPWICVYCRDLCNCSACRKSRKKYGHLRKMDAKSCVGRRGRRRQNYSTTFTNGNVENLYIISDIEKVRVVNGKKEYFVVWRDNPAVEKSWEPAENVFAPPFVAAIENKKKKKTSKNKTKTKSSSKKPKISVNKTKNKITKTRKRRKASKCSLNSKNGEVKKFPCKQSNKRRCVVSLKQRNEAIKAVKCPRYTNYSQPLNTALENTATLQHSKSDYEHLFDTQNEQQLRASITDISLLFPQKDQSNPNSITENESNKALNATSNQHNKVSSFAAVSCDRQPNTFDSNSNNHGNHSGCHKDRVNNHSFSDIHYNCDNDGWSCDHFNHDNLFIVNQTTNENNKNDRNYFNFDINVNIHNFLSSTF